MNLSEDGLSRLLSESKTIARPEFVAADVADRVQRFWELYEQLDEKPMAAALIFQRPGAASVDWHPIGAKLVVGRLPKSDRHSDGCDLAFNDEQLSRRHFEISLGDGFYWLRDLNSRNGTYLNTGPSMIGETVLKQGDLILAGQMVFAFVGNQNVAL